MARKKAETQVIRVVLKNGKDKMLDPDSPEGWAVRFRTDRYLMTGSRIDESHKGVNFIITNYQER